jgi:hypothetical protein
MDIEQKTLNALRWIIGILNKHKIDYQITGGFAAKLYGSPRKLNDIDIDIPEKHFKTILPEISEYITFGPGRFKDEKWDGQFITLNYQGQEIDLGAIDTIRISNKKETKWIPYANFSLETLDVKVNNIDVKVILPKKLIEYKRELNGEHQIVDIEAAERYLSRHNLG